MVHYFQENLNNGEENVASTCVEPQGGNSTENVIATPQPRTLK